MRRSCLNCVYQLAQSDQRVVFIGSDLGIGVLDEMKKEMPDRWFMEGVSEQHIIGMAAGLAMEGFIPYVNTIATFLTRRCFEQLVVDLCMHQLPVRLLGNGAGVVYAPLGPTHQAIEDIAIMRAIPNMTVVAPCDADEMERVMHQTLEWPGPIYIRLAKGGDEIVSRQSNSFEIGKGIMMRDPGDVLFVTTGVMAQRALSASEQLQRVGISSGVLHLHTVKPLDKDLLLSGVREAQLVVTAEEHVRNGGLGSSVLEAVHDANMSNIPKIIRLGLADCFVSDYGSQEGLFRLFLLDSESITSAVQEAFSA